MSKTAPDLTTPTAIKAAPFLIAPFSMEGPTDDQTLDGWVLRDKAHGIDYPFGGRQQAVTAIAQIDSVGLRAFLVGSPSPINAYHVNDDLWELPEAPTLA